MPENITDLGDLDLSTPPDFDKEFEEMYGPLGEESELGDNTEEESANSETETDNTEDKEEFITIGDEQIPIKEAKELVSKGKDYTKKTQELAEQRRSLEENAARTKDAQVILEAWNSGDPKVRQQIATVFMQEAGLTQPTLNQPTSTPEIPYEELSDGEKYLYQQNQQLQQKLAHFEHQNKSLVGTLDELKGYIQGQRGTDQAIHEAAQLSAKFGITVSAQELTESAKRTGISDLEAAWLKENSTKLTKGFKQEEKVVKPNTPSGQTRTFDPKAPGMTADRIISLLNKGFTPKDN